MEKVKRGLVDYPFQLRPDVWVKRRLPADLTHADVEQIIRQLEAMVVND